MRPIGKFWRRQKQRAEVIIDLAKQGINGDIEYIYWVEWDDTPGIPVAITDNRIEPVDLREK